jgi:hypothetical protein
VERLPPNNDGDDEMKTTIDMAHEVYGAHTEWTGAPLDRLEQLVALVRADQREIDAKVCDDLLVPVHISLDNESLWEAATLDCAEAIRARGNT